MRPRTWPRQVYRLGICVKFGAWLILILIKSWWESWWRTSEIRSLRDEFEDCPDCDADVYDLCREHEARFDEAVNDAIERDRQ